MCASSLLPRACLSGYVTAVAREMGQNSPPGGSGAEPRSAPTKPLGQGEMGRLGAAGMAAFMLHPNVGTTSPTLQMRTLTPKRRILTPIHAREPDSTQSVS